MPSEPRPKENKPSLVAGITAALGVFFRSLPAQAAKLGGQLQLGAERLVEKIPPHRRRLVLIAAIGVLAVLLCIIAGVSFATRDTSGKPEISSAGNAAIGARGDSSGRIVPQQIVIPPDELFLPFEPDFVPGVLLEREQRTVWTAEDAAPLWQDPLKNGEQEWRDQIEKTIDEIMESVP